MEFEPLTLDLAHYERGVAKMRNIPGLSAYEHTLLEELHRAAQHSLESFDEKRKALMLFFPGVVASIINKGLTFDNAHQHPL